MVFDILCLIKSISAVTNYNSSSCFYRKRIVQKLWSFLFSHHMICIDIPPWIGKYLLSEKFFSIFYVYQSGEYNDLRIHFIEVDFVATFVVKTTQVPVQLLSVVDTGTCPSVVYYPLCFKMKWQDSQWSPIYAPILQIPLLWRHYMHTSQRKKLFLC